MKSIPAFPVSTDFGTRVESAPGMKLRDYFAAKAMPEFNWNDPADCAKMCYEIADAMLAARDA